ncbi:protein UBASH3A homolog [Contarinia nasturtii]|uniref:protein UBASH3A homolog n=1 Tax=Contarinia nasturtii TaxID=265458 RepID=UPI0012D489B4|nr:protein UBASH3A homolog [Contarinia nasturtii]
MANDDMALNTLIDLGIKKDRVEKALAASGNRCPIKAMEWLISHAKDPYLDSDNLKREYTLVAVPAGAFGEQLSTFWCDSRELCDFSLAQNRFPHISIVDFFTIRADKDLQLREAVIKTVNEMNDFNRGIRLKRGEKVGAYIGYDLEENDEQFFRRIGNKFIDIVRAILPTESPQPEVSKLLCISKFKTTQSSSTIAKLDEPKEFHMTIPCSYKKPTLNSSISRLEINDATEWDLRLYSRDKRLYSIEDESQIFRAHQAHKAHNSGDLSFGIGDYFSASTKDVEAGTKNKIMDEQLIWGVSITTGSRGNFPIRYVERVPESDCWVLHTNVPFIGSGINCAENIIRSSNIRREPRESLEDCAREFIESEKRMIAWDPTLGNIFPVLSSTQKIFIMRHGERVDYSFPQWTKFCITSNGYQRLDLNLPAVLPDRRHEINSRQTWKHDSPLTNQGWNQARLTGDMLNMAKITIDYVYCSPAFRCIQSAAALLEGLKAQKNVKIRIEPALFEWCNSSRKIPTFLTYEELLLAQYNIDETYVPVVRIEDLKHETLPELYARNSKISEELSKILNENIFIVGHAVNLETNSQPLLGTNPILSLEKLKELMKKVSYVSMLTLEKMGNREWRVSPAVLPLTHGRNFQFDWITFTDRTL